MVDTTWQLTSEKLPILFCKNTKKISHKKKKDGKLVKYLNQRDALKSYPKDMYLELPIIYQWFVAGTVMWPKNRALFS